MLDIRLKFPRLQINRRRRGRGRLPILCGAALLFLTQLSAAEPAAKPIKIGVSVPLSGDGAFYGADVKNATVFANEVLAQNRYQLIIEDDRCNGKDAAAVAQKLVSVDQVRYVLGFPCSGALLAAAPIYEKAQVTVISAMAMASQISSAGDYIFRTCPNNRQNAAVLYGYVAKRHRRLGIISEETDYPQSLAQEFLKSSQGGTVMVNAVSYLPETIDFRPILLKLKASGVDALFINPQAEPAFVRILEQLTELHWRPSIYGNLYPSSPTFLKLAGPRAEGIVFSDLPFFDRAISSQGRSWYAQFVKRFGEPVSSDLYFVTAVAAFTALDQALRSGQEVKGYLYSQTFSSVVDRFAFDQNGDIVGLAPVLKRIENGLPLPAQ